MLQPFGGFEVRVDDLDSRPGAESAGVNAILPGMKVDCVIGLCRVLDFGTATEVGGVTY